MRWHDREQMRIRAILDAERDIYDGLRNWKGDVMPRRIPENLDDHNGSV